MCNSLHDAFCFEKGFVYSSHLCVIIREFAKDDIKLINLVDKIRNVEEKVRNIAAHQIVSISDEGIEKLTGMTTLAIVNSLKELFTYAGFNIKKEYWNAYDDMNSFIIDKIEKKNL